MKITFDKLPTSFGLGDGLYCRGAVPAEQAALAASKRGGRYASATAASVSYPYARIVSSRRILKPSAQGYGAFAITVVAAAPRKTKSGTAPAVSAADAPLVPRKQHLPNPYRVCGRVSFIGLTDEDGKIVAEAKVDTSFVKAALFSRRWRAAYDKNGKVTGVQGCHWAKSRNRGSNERLGRVVVDAPKGTRVSYINGDTLDCRKANLRVETVGAK